MAGVITLVIEASTYVGSAALLDDGRIAADRTVAMRGREHEALMPAVAALLDECRLAPDQLGRVVCGSGPGAFTSLRIAGGIAKGIALAVEIPLIPVSSLALLAASRCPLRPGLYLTVVDAMRGERYAQPWLVALDLTVTMAGPLALVPSAEVYQLAERLGATPIGPGQSGDGAVDPHARAAAALPALLASTVPANLTAWEPGYGRLAEAQVKWEAEHGRPLLSS